MKTFAWSQAAGGALMTAILPTPDLQSLALDVFCGHCSSGNEQHAPRPHRRQKTLVMSSLGVVLVSTYSAHIVIKMSRLSLVLST